jgi:hypothetical protein
MLRREPLLIEYLELKPDPSTSLVNHHPTAPRILYTIAGIVESESASQKYLNLYLSI